MTREEWDQAQRALRMKLNKLWPGGRSGQEKADDVMWQILTDQIRPVKVTR